MEASPETGRSKRKREAKAAFERRAIREALGRGSKGPIDPARRTDPRRIGTPGRACRCGGASDGQHGALSATQQTEERLEEREDPPEVMMEHVAVLLS